MRAVLADLEPGIVVTIVDPVDDRRVGPQLLGDDHQADRHLASTIECQHLGRQAFIHTAGFVARVAGNVPRVIVLPALRLPVRRGQRRGVRHDLRELVLKEPTQRVDAQHEMGSSLAPLEPGCQRRVIQCVAWLWARRYSIAVRIGIVQRIASVPEGVRVGILLQRVRGIGTVVVHIEDAVVVVIVVGRIAEPDPARHVLGFAEDRIEVVVQLILVIDRSIDVDIQARRVGDVGCVVHVVGYAIGIRVQRYQLP